VRSVLVLLVLMYAAFLFNWQITLTFLVTVPMQAYIMYVEFPIIGKEPPS
jgi:ABC-type transport system involved in cytochrome bd biosynthesis fused ATPase/permease subunit